MGILRSDENVYRRDNQINTLNVTNNGFAATGSQSPMLNAEMSKRSSAGATMVAVYKHQDGVVAYQLVFICGNAQCGGSFICGP